LRAFVKRVRMNDLALHSIELCAGVGMPGEGFRAMKRGPWNPDRLLAMYRMYCDGKSLAQVGAAFDVTRQSVHCLFDYHGLPRRQKTELPFIEFNGAKYTLRNTGYFGRTDGERTLLHRDMWEHAHGPIPNGWDVHHLDGNRLHNHLDNFECLSKAKHTRLHSHGQNQHTKRAACG
jgi:hypothetical protein